MTISVRGSRLTYVNNASSLVFTLPPSSAAGDLCAIFTEHGFQTTVPSGWSTVDNSAGTNCNGACFTKVLTSGDISTGTVTISFGGTYYGHVGGIAFVGAIGGLRTFIFGRNSSGATSRSLTTNADPLSGDYAVYWGSGRGNVTITNSGGSALQTSSQTNSSAVMTGGLLGSSGAVSNTFTFSSAPTGDYYGIAIFQETPSMKVSKANFGIITGYSGMTISKANFGVIVSPASLLVTKAMFGIVVAPGPPDRRRMSCM